MDQQVEGRQKNKTIKQERNERKQSRVKMEKSCLCLLDQQVKDGRRWSTRREEERDEK